MNCARVVPLVIASKRSLRGNLAPPVIASVAWQSCNPVYCEQTQFAWQS